MNEIMLNDENIKTKIYEIRGVQVMLDRDLAKLYGCANGTKTINLAVKRNIEKFPNDFYFQLSNEEASRFQNETLNNKRGSNIKYLPYVFTEQGIAMLSSVLKTENATKVSVAIMRAFVAMRHYLIDNKDIYVTLNNINNKLIEHDKNFEILFNRFNKIEEKELVFFNGQIFDAYSKVIDILKEAKQELIIIDSYADKKVLDIIKDLDIDVTIVMKTKSLLKKETLEKYNKQYHNLRVIYDDSWHDRYIIIDKEKIYHLGASLNYIGTKTFNINKLEDIAIVNLLIDKLKIVSN